MTGPERLPSGWMSTTIEGIASPQRNALVGGPFGSNLVSNDYVKDGVPVIRGQNLGQGRWIAGDFAFVSREKAASLSANIARPGDVVFTQRGTLGQVALVPDEPIAEYVISQSQMKLTVDPNKADPLFIYYLFTSEAMREYIKNNAIQTGVPHTNLTILRSTPIIIPADVGEQRAIAHVLGTLDDKIELNRQMNQTLDEIARTLFRSWFVDFDPVRSKAEGRQPEGMDAETAALFPDRLVDSTLGPIPEGWATGRLGDVVTIHDSKRIPLSATQRAKRKGPFPYYGATSIMDYVDDYLFDGIYVLVGEDGSVINSDFSPVLQYVWGKFWINNHAHVLAPNGSISTEHLLLILRHSNIAPFVTGAVQAKVSQGNLRRLPIVVAPDPLSSKFGEMIASMFALVRANTDEAQSLSELRDTLLPELVSGKMEIPPKLMT